MSVLLDPGRLSLRLELQQDIETADGVGGFTSAWTAVRDVWAEIRPLGSLPVERASNTGNDVTHEILVRHRPDIRSGMRFRKGARLFLIETLHDPDETARLLLCRCRECL